MTHSQLDLFGNETTVTEALRRSVLEPVITTALIGVTAEQLVALMTNEVDAIVEFERLCRGRRAGNRISLMFNPHRLDTPTIRSASIVASMNDPKFLAGVTRALAWKEDRVADLLYQVLQLGINGVQYVNEFPPYLARTIISDYGARTILDPCAGWGGRMIGAASVGAYYFGFEPSTRTHAGLLDLGAWLKQFDTGFDFHLVNEPFEDAVLPNRELFDLAVTSPPYYDTEHYADEPTQAAVRYADYADFEQGFLLPLVTKALEATRRGLILNIGSRKYPLRQFVKSQGGIELVEYRLSGAAGLDKDQNDGEAFFHLRSL